MSSDKGLRLSRRIQVHLLPSNLTVFNIGVRGPIDTGAPMRPPLEDPKTVSEVFKDHRDNE